MTYTLQVQQEMDIFVGKSKVEGNEWIAVWWCQLIMSAALLVQVIDAKNMEPVWLGQTVAIFGQTGAGKSTIINLIERFYDATSGEILIDGIDIRKYNLQALRKNISISMQDVFLFSNTIEENISYGVSEADNSRVTWAAEMADASNFIQKLSDSYETVVGERGVGLSGGQKQRITLARSIIKDPSILILDDTTSALDVETEAMIQREFKSVYKDRTCFIIAHRISSIKDSDLILVLDDGKDSRKWYT